MRAIWCPAPAGDASPRTAPRAPRSLPESPRGPPNDPWGPPAPQQKAGESLGKYFSQKAPKRLNGQNLFRVKTQQNGPSHGAARSQKGPPKGPQRGLAWPYNYAISHAISGSAHLSTKASESGNPILSFIQIFGHVRQRVSN